MGISEDGTANYGEGPANKESGHGYARRLIDRGSPVVPALIEKLKDSNKDAIDILIEIVEQSDDFTLVKEAIQTLGETGPDAKDGISAIIGAFDFQKPDRLNTSIETYMNEGLDILAAIEAKNKDNYEYEWMRESLHQLSALALRAIAHESSVPGIIDLLQNKKINFLPFIILIKTLGDIGPPAKDAVPLLITLLNDHRDSVVRRETARVLGNIGDTKAVPALIHKLTDEEFYVRRYSAEALGKIGDDTALPVLLEMLKEENREVTEAVKEALVNIKDGHEAIVEENKG